jgi:hypothetical protein
MSKKRSPTSDTGLPKIDNLKLINGIGPAVEKRLNGNGIFTYAQLAALSPADIAAAVSNLAGLSAERILKQDWIGQARKLAAASTSSEAQTEGEVPIETQIFIENTPEISPSVKTQKGVDRSMSVYHSATFRVELLLDENNKVYSSHILHLQSRLEHTWSDLPKSELLDFMSQSAGVNVLSEEPVHTDIEKPVTPLVKKSELVGRLRVRNMHISGFEETSHQKFLSNDQPLDIHLVLDFTEMTIPDNTPLIYKATVFGKLRNPGSRSGQIVGESEGIIILADTVTIDIKCHPLPQGTYQLTATIVVALPDSKLTPKSGTIAIIDGGLVQVY